MTYLDRLTKHPQSIGLLRIHGKLKWNEIHLLPTDAKAQRTKTILKNVNDFYRKI